MHLHQILDTTFADITQSDILKHCRTLPDTNITGYLRLSPQVIVPNFAVFLVAENESDFYSTEVRQEADGIKLSCTCQMHLGNLCDHQIRCLYNILHNKDLKLFFDINLRHQRLRQEGEDYGLSTEDNPDSYFHLLFQDNQIHFIPLIKDLIPINDHTIEHLEQQLWQQAPTSPRDLPTTNQDLIVVLGRNKYYDHLYMELYQVARTKQGLIKAPLTLTDPLEILQRSQEVTTIKFYSSLLRFKNNYRVQSTEADLEALTQICLNPDGLECYMHLPEISEHISPSSLKSVQLSHPVTHMELTVSQKKQFYEVNGLLLLDGKKYELSKLNPKFNYFILTGNQLQLIQQAEYLKIIHLFSKQDEKFILHHSKFDRFRERILNKIEDKIKVTYTYLKRIAPADLNDLDSNNHIQKIIYLSESGHFILITPVIRYGNTEVPVLSFRQLHAIDMHGNPYIIRRDEEAEIQFISALKRQHPDFSTQAPRDALYLNKSTFLDENWFLDAFEEWRNQSIRIYGFNHISKNKRNAHKAEVSVVVESGINWFLPEIQVFFGKQKVSLKNLQKAAKNRKRYVLLEDGTEGMLPENWLLRMEKYFSAGEVDGGQLRIPKYNFQMVSEIFEDEELDKKVQRELQEIRVRLESFNRIQHIKTPIGLQATLRNYQKEGLNWLNFLDSFGFGGCLADDMGLGKTVQIIAFILLLKEKNGSRAHLIVVPTSLIFNWKAEIKRFAPELNIEVYHGGKRTNVDILSTSTDILLTTYGTMVADVQQLRKATFDYIFLDESQAIKNPDSQRYKAARTLRARNRMVLTGTPFENNSMDIFGQLSFACPGLLGSKIHFMNTYLNPIDRFGVEDPALALQKRINPFILRRTKALVAPELPDKTEQILYCEMGADQQRLYRAYEQEFYNYLNSKEEGDIKRNRLHVLQGLTKLRQICNAPSLLNDEAYYGADSAKISVLMEQIMEKQAGQKILVFSQFVGMLDLIRAELIREEIPHTYLTGQSTKREEIVHEFQHNPKVRVFLISLKAGGTGLNLTEAEYVYLVDPWWNPAVESQAIDRSYRIGQKRNVMATRLITPDTIEEKMMKLQQNKLDRANELIATDNHMLKNLSKHDLLSLLTP